MKTKVIRGKQENAFRAAAETKREGSSLPSLVSDSPIRTKRTKISEYDSEIIKMYVEEKRSTVQIGRIIGCHAETIRWRLKKFNIQLRSLSESISLSTKGSTKSESHRKNLSISKKGYWEGEKNPNWRGGIASGWDIYSDELITWKDAVLKKNNYTCQECGYNGPKTLQAHHIFPKRDFFHLAFVVKNGITLCYSCHKKTWYKEYLFVMKYLERDGTIAPGTWSTKNLRRTI